MLHWLDVEGRWVQKFNKMKSAVRASENSGIFWPGDQLKYTLTQVLSEAKMSTDFYGIWIKPFMWLSQLGFPLIQQHFTLHHIVELHFSSKNCCLSHSLSSFQNVPDFGN